MYKNTISKLLIFIVLIANMALASAANNALKFSHGKYVSLDAIEMGGNLTFSSWAKFDKSTRWSRIFDFGDGENSNINALMAGLEGDSGKLVFYSFDKNGNYTEVSDGDNAKSFGKVPVDGSWIHVVATINDSGKARLYANGALIGSQDNAYIAPMSTRKYGYIANSAWDDNFSDIQINDFGIWKKALSAEEVESLYLDGISGVSSPDYYWNFDQVDTTTLIPVKGNIKGELINIVESDWTVSVIPNKEERKALAIIISKGLSIENVAAILGEQTGAQRTAAIKALASRISNGLTVENTAAILGEQTGAQRTAAIKALASKQLMQGNWSDVSLILGNQADDTRGHQSYQHRDNTIRALLGSNAAKKTYIKTPLSVTDTVTLLEGITHRGNLIQYMADRYAFVTGLTTKQANLINGSLEDESKDLVFKALSGENLLKKVYYGSVTIAKIPKKIIQDKVKKEEIKKIVAEIQRVNIVDFDIAFEGNHWKLKDSAKNELNKLGAVLSSNVLNNGVFELIGHVAGKGGTHKVCIDSKHKVVNNSRFAMECWDTDNAWAQTLSDRRAQSVRDYLLKNFTIPAGRIKAYGVGHSQHKFNNPDDAGNRRVEVKYIKQ